MTRVNPSIRKRILETAAMTIIGDSLLCVLSPRRHLTLWLSGPRWWRRAWEPFVEHAGLTRALGAFGLAFGVWLAWKQEPLVSGPASRTRSASRIRRSYRSLQEAAQ
ncbi:MAG TPA: hypothetical protein VG269_08300 [Tepidisphaeraceae bacterium]|jgi:hypothetical protein|nr:hypothetical protein [Tepidisphaeraceae bacterium]